MEEIKLINFIDLDINQKKMVLQWRNNPIIKEWMYNKDEIKLDDHLKFINSLKNSKDKLYFLVQNDDEYIGVIDFTNIIDNESLHMGIYSNPNLKGKGRILLETIINFSFNELNAKKIYSEVYTKNNKAHELYKRFNFIDKSTKVINDEEVMIMELTNENR